MTHTYNITGMTCNKCVAKAKDQLLKLGDVSGAEVQLSSPQATITMQRHLPISLLQEALHKAGNYRISESFNVPHGPANKTEERSWLQTYLPILLIGAYITGVTLLIEAVKGSFSWHSWMPHFMAAFFLVFSFFKMINLKGFAESYASYDIIAKQWKAWGYVYAFIESGLGIAYLTGFEPVITNIITFTVMSVSIIGVLETVLNKRKIQCACLGAVFNRPMSTVTVVEDSLMIAMSGLMLLSVL